MTQAKVNWILPQLKSSWTRSYSDGEWSQVLCSGSPEENKTHLIYVPGKSHLSQSKVAGLSLSPPLTLSLNLALSSPCSPPVSNYLNILASLFLGKDWKKLMCKQYSLWPLWLGCLSQHRHESPNIRLIEERSPFSCSLICHLSL